MDAFDANQLLVISDEKVPVAAYQAIYHKLTAKVERLSQVFPDAYLINANHLIQLDNLLEQAVRQYGVQGKTSTCAVSFHKHEKLSPSSFEKFRVFNFEVPKPTSKISYQLNFFTVLPVEVAGAQDIVQRFKVSVLIDQDFVEEEDQNQLPMFMRGYATGNNINLAVEYSDYNVGRNLQVVVQDWVETLPHEKVPEWIKSSDRHSDFFLIMVPRLLLMLALLGTSWSVQTSELLVFSRSSFLALSWSVASYIIGHVLVVQYYRAIQEARPLTFICLTKGDRDRRERLVARRRSRSRLAFGLLTLCAITVPANLLSSWIFEHMKVLFG